MSFEEVTRLAQQRGFFFKSAESYPNSPAGFIEYGPLGVAVRNRLVELWRRMIVKKERMLEIDGAQILPRAVFQASGHLENFNDPFVKCSKCGSVFRPDKLIEDKIKKPVPEKLSNAEYDQLMEKSGVRCLKCGSKLSGTKRFNMMFKLGIGPDGEEAYLRPETAQSIFVDFPILFKTLRGKLPLGVAQVGRVFRNEIAPRQGPIRLRELNQAEVEVFFNPAKTNDPKFDFTQSDVLSMMAPDGKEVRVERSQAMKEGLVPNELVWHYLALLNRYYSAVGLPADKVRFRILSDEDRAFYARASYDFEVKLSIGWLELVACNYRGGYDLESHQKVSGTNFTVDDGGEKVLPHVFELSLGLDRSLYALLETSMRAEGERGYLALPQYLAPFEACVFPLVNKDGLDKKAEKLAEMIGSELDLFYDDSGSIGRRYARADEVGIPLCVTVDHDTLKDDSVTLRARDTRTQERVPIASLAEKIRGLTSFPK